MSADMSDEAKALVLEGQAALRPAASDKARIALALQAKLQAPEVGPDVVEAPEPNTATALGAPWLGKVALLTGSVLTVAAAYYFTRSSHSDVSPHDTAVVPSMVQAVTSLPVVDTRADGVASHSNAAPAATAVAVEPSSSNSKLVSRAVSGDRLAEEAALLEEAEKAYHAGNFKRTLALASEHRAKFPKGVLTRERVHLRIVALCGLGRHDEADKELVRSTKSGTATKACEQ